MSRVSAACMSVFALSATLHGVAHAQVADRYGPAAPSYDATPGGAAPVLAGAPVRMLSWPGKVAPAMATPSDQPAPGMAPNFTPMRTAVPPTRAVQVASAAVPPSPLVRPANRYVAPAAYAPSAPSAPLSSGPRYGLVQAVPPSSAARSARAPSIYDAPAPAGPGAPRQTVAAAPGPKAAPAQAANAAPADAAHPGWAPPRRAWSQAGDTGVRFYSLHRQYGVAPDPAPIPPQFFAATADLGEPAGPMTRTISGAGSAAQAARAVQAAQTETSSDPASSQP
jgi:hypothetical protein